jgi:hypothetical protein
MAMSQYTSSAVSYFAQDGKANLRAVLKLLQRARRKRADLKAMKIVFMTGYGEGPLLAIRNFKDDHPKMIAVTFPPNTPTSDGRPHFIPEEVGAYLKAMKVDIISTRLPFDGMDGTTMGDHEMRLVKSVLSKLGRSVPLCVQAVLQACDHGLVEQGEEVIGVTGDLAAVITASTTASFLSPTSPFYIREFICKAGTRGNGIPDPGVPRKMLLLGNSPQ